MKDAQRDECRRTLLAALVQLSAYAQERLCVGGVSTDLSVTIARVIGEIGELMPDDRVELVNRVDDTFSYAIDSFEEINGWFGRRDLQVRRIEEEVRAARNRAGPLLRSADELIRRLMEAEEGPVAAARR